MACDMPSGSGIGKGTRIVFKGSVGSPREERLRSGWGTQEGWPYPLGATWMPDERAFNFAIYSKHATAVTLLAFRADEPAVPCLVRDLHHLKNKSGRVWHCRLTEQELQGAAYYAYRVDGPRTGSGYDLHAFDRDKVLLDPYARQIHFPTGFERAAAMRPGSNLGQSLLGVLSRNGRSFDWQGDRIRPHEHDLVICELHVRGFTRRDAAGVPEGHRGTYLGVVDRIPYLVDLGVTAVELMPVFQFDPQEGNYWGYMPINFFAPHAQYACDANRAAEEFRTMVRALHAADIEVILDVVFNHTAEGGSGGPCYSFKGVDNSSYYITSGNPAHPYCNFSGTGNTLHTKNRHVVRMILDSMRSWVEHYHVDGFRFDLASIFNRRGDGTVSNDESRLIAAVRADPILGNVRLIAEPWDAAGLNQLGRRFPGKRWFQWNGSYRDDVRRFVRGDRGLLPAIVRRMYGSDDLFPDSLEEACHPYQSVNYVAAHDGFTLYDLVAYQHRHNWRNGEQNRDGPDENFSWNCGWEGDRDLPADVESLRHRQARNFCCLLMLANGTPMFRAGDEFLHTQAGNSNPFNQDNETSWLDWSRLDRNRDFHRFFRGMIAFRKRHPSLCRSRFWRDDVRWFGAIGPVDWSGDAAHFAFHLDGRSERDDDLYVMINAEARDLEFRIQHAADRRWGIAIDTARPSPDDLREEGDEPSVSGSSIVVSARSVVVLRACADARSDDDRRGFDERDLEPVVALPAAVAPSAKETS